MKALAFVWNIMYKNAWSGRLICREKKKDENVLCTKLYKNEGISC